MKLSTVAIFLAVSITGAFAKPAGIVLGYQDTLGQYSFGYSAPHQARSEVRSLDGVTRGSYSYVDAAGLVQSTDYTADGINGFRVAATNLPQAPAPVQETPEVAAARAAHLLALEEAAKGSQAPQAPEAEESDSVTILSKSADKEPEPAEPIVEAAPEPKEEVQSPEAAEEKPEAVEEHKGRAIEEPAVAPVIASPAAASLPVPLIPVNFDLPTISAYSGIPAAGAKAVETLPQSTPAQAGVITPAGTTLKTVPVPQVVAVAPQITLANDPADPVGTSGTARDFGHYERARAVFAPAVGPLNVIPLGYDPTISSFFRYAPFPYITYNIL